MLYNNQDGISNSIPLGGKISYLKIQLKFYEKRDNAKLSAWTKFIDKTIGILKANGKVQDEHLDTSTFEILENSVQ